MSEPESEEDYVDTAPDHVIVADDGDDDDDYISPDEKTSKSLTGKTKRQPNKSSAVAQGKKRKAPGRPVEYHGPVSSSAAPRKKQKLAKLDDPYLDVVGEEPATSEISAPADTISPAPKQDSPTPTLPPKKPKLPTIKKTKLVGSSSGVNTPTSAIVPVKKPLDLPINAKLSHDGVRKTLMGKTDIDLSNKSIYQEIFLKTVSVFLFIQSSPFHVYILPFIGIGRRGYSRAYERGGTEEGIESNEGGSEGQAGGRSGQSQPRLRSILARQFHPLAGTFV